MKLLELLIWKRRIIISFLTFEEFCKISEKKENKIGLLVFSCAVGDTERLVIGSCHVSKCN